MVGLSLSAAPNMAVVLRDIKSLYHGMEETGKKN